MRGITVLLVAIEKMVSELLDFGGILGLANDTCSDKGGMLLVHGVGRPV